MPIAITTSESPAEVLAAWVEDAARAAIEDRGAFSIALPGGSVATTCFPRLATASIDWHRTHFFWGDERAVPPEHTDSNFRVAKETWLDRIEGARIHRMEAERPDLQAERASYERELRNVGLDLALLGVGPDGHVCSLFPGHALLDETEKWVATITDSPKPPPTRLTLTMPALAAAKTVVVVALGAGKAEMIASALEPSSSLPVALALRGARDARLLLDPPAAARLAR